jgi:hypothetical protein
MPPSALTTTTTGCLRASFSTMCFKLRMLFTEPTDVPPNFKTFIQFKCLIFDDATKQMWTFVELECVLILMKWELIIHYPRYERGCKEKFKTNLFELFHMKLGYKNTKKSHNNQRFQAKLINFAAN